MTDNMVTKIEQEKGCYEFLLLFFLHHYTQQVDFAQIKSELQLMELMEKNDLAMIKAENDRLVNDIEKLKQRLSRRNHSDSGRREVGLEFGEGEG
ncbi:hypothetical protein K435DRAFT_932675 [Dendrothele bispora CBS 962.96]|uniref:Uncharacterized protein n=1 Tax=Dendrothele bispora (strain CBS 962.96) TaxID=1314807 RepID=A0A4S8MDT3_DENBC|nr:hypothetical protein K435DRAFT_932675 [Dendrothele bispora CBS 962.96]